MNVFELVLFVLLTALLFLLGRFLSKHIGVAGWLVFIVPAGSFWLFVARSAIRAAYFETRNSLRNRPICYAGKCTSRQYVLVESRTDNALFRCRCGDLYLASGDEFLRVLPDNSKQPYMVRSPSGNWELAASR